LAAVAVALAFVPASSGQIQESFTVRSVEFSGLEERVSEQFIRSQLEVQPGQPYSRPAVSRDIIRLYALGHFVHIRVDGEISGTQIDLTYIFEEKREIDEVTVVGNRKVKLREVRAVLNWRRGAPFAEEGYEEERQALLGLYLSKGFLNATVDIVVEEVSPSRVRVTYFIEEGRKARIRSVHFVGNEALTTRKLRKAVKTKPRRFFLGGRYDEAKFENDIVNIQKEYFDRGRLEAEVLETDFVYSPNGKKLDITISLQEGEEYRVDTLEFAGNTVFDEDELLRSVEVLPGDIHNVSQVEDDGIAIREGYQDSGYVGAQIRDTVVTVDRQAKTTKVVHDISEGGLAYIREIKVIGNSVTKDEVVRRRLLLSPGDRFDGALYRASQNRAESTGYFEDVRLSLLPTDLMSDQWADLQMDVTEGSTGNFNFGGGFSTDAGLGGFAEVRLNNFDIMNWPRFSGGGQQFAMRLSVGELSTSYNISFTDPEIVGYPFAFGFDFFDETVETSGGSDFTQKTQGAQLRLGKALSPYVNARTSIRYADVDISNIGLVLHPDLRELRNPGTTYSNTWGISRNTIDNPRDPTTGSSHGLQIEVAGFGGDNDFVKIEHDSNWYRNMGKEKKWVLSLRTRTGYAIPYGDKDLVSISDRFFAGGTSTVRGYENRDIGPKVRSLIWFGEKQAIGGEVRMLNSFEVKYIASEMVRLYGFVDSGGVWKSDSDIDLGDIKYSVGLGIGFNVPKMGPLRLDYGIPLNPDDDQGSGRLHLIQSFRLF
jgi:outer membrane protein insertion porin family